VCGERGRGEEEEGRREGGRGTRDFQGSGRCLCLLSGSGSCSRIKAGVAERAAAGSPCSTECRMQNTPRMWDLDLGKHEPHFRRDINHP
jgi:hypothetical protein